MARERVSRVAAECVALVIAVLVGAPLPAQVRGADAALAGPRVRTASGTVAGVTLPGGTRVFRGVPFAAPPVRDLRWKAPQPVRPWRGVRPADRFAYQCMQGRVFADMVFRNAGTSEDCLYLNVWTPAMTAGARLPVLVYFFGGGFIAGDGSEPRYDGASMARRGIVVVTVNYRLGVFGFLAHPALTRESPHHASGNYALLDQVAALHWVRANIAAFGGDPHRVTIGGESAGSISVSALMVSPLASRLFQGAIGESGGAFPPTIATPSLADAEQRGERFAASLGATSLATLRAMPAMTLLQATLDAHVLSADPIVDGYFLPARPAALYAAGRAARVPLLAGWNSEEGNARSLLGGVPTPARFGAVLRQLFGVDAAAAAAVFPASTPEEAARSATALASDRFIVFSTWKWLELQGGTNGAGVPVYRYLFSRPRPPTVAGTGDVPRGAVHSAEIEYALGNLASNHVFAWTPDDYRVSRTMQGYFANFIRTGNPNGPGLPAWPAGAVRSDGSAWRMRIDVVSQAERESRAQLELLDRFYARLLR